MSMARFVTGSSYLLCTPRHRLNWETTCIRSLTCQILEAFGLFLLLVTVTPSLAQGPLNPNAGILLWSTNDFGINLATSGINIDIPLRSKVGAIPFSSRLFGTSQAYESTAGGGAIIYTNMGIGPYSDPTAVTMFSTFTVGNCPQHPTEPSYTYTLWWITDSTGAIHSLGKNKTWTLSSYCPTTPNPIFTGDGSGYTFVVTSSGLSGTFTIYDRSGLTWSGSCNSNNGCGTSGAVVDSDNNRISGCGFCINGMTVTDTLDTPVLTANGYTGDGIAASYSYAEGNTTQYYTAGTNNGSGRESVKTFDLRGFSTCVQFDSRSRRRCGNVGTRVLCGFPSSEGGQNRCGRVRSFRPRSAISTASPRFLGHSGENVLFGAGGAKTGVSQKAA
jgi:hypothetical protein